MNTKQVLLAQFAAAYDENGWFVALKNALNNLTASEAAWKPEKLDNSIWETLAHLNYYHKAYLERFKGIDYQYTKETNDETFAGDASASEEAWRAELENFAAIMDEWRALIAAADEAKFGEKVSATHASTWAELISDLTMHAAHHGGQIVVIRKLQGSWDASKGVS